MIPASSGLADAKTDGDKGIEEYRNGNLIEAMYLLEKSALKGYIPAQITLAHILDKAEQNSEAFHWYQQAAKNKDAAGLFGLGGMYAKGEGTPADPPKAGQLIKQSALLGHLPAMRAYAYALEHGQLGFSQNNSAAVEWFIKAANSGDKVSMRRLRNAYTLGQLGMPVDPEQASKWDAEINMEN
jgi:TPR repeat protein